MFGLGSTPRDEKREASDLVVADSEYAVVKLRPSWGLLSIALALLSLPLRFWARHLPWHPRQYWYEPGRMLLGILALSAAGALVGWLGLHYGRSRGLAKIGLFLNVTVAGVLLLFAGFLMFYFRFLR